MLWSFVSSIDSWFSASWNWTSLTKLCCPLALRPFLCGRHSRMPQRARATTILIRSFIFSSQGASDLNCWILRCVILMSARAMVSLLNQQARNDTVCDASYIVFCCAGVRLMLKDGPWAWALRLRPVFWRHMAAQKASEKLSVEIQKKTDLFQTHDTYCILIVALLQLFAIFEMFSCNISTCMLLCIIHISTVGAWICTSQPIRRRIPTAFEILQHDKQWPDLG